MVEDQIVDALHRPDGSPPLPRQCQGAVPDSGYESKNAAARYMRSFRFAHCAAAGSSTAPRVSVNTSFPDRSNPYCSRVFGVVESVKLLFGAAKDDLFHLFLIRKPAVPIHRSRFAIMRTETTKPAPVAPASRQTFNFEVPASAQRGPKAHEWADMVQSSYFPMDVKIGADFRGGSIENIDVGELRVCTLHSDPMVTERHQSYARAEAEEFYVIEMPELSPVLIQQRGRDALVAPGNFTLVSGAEPYRFANPAHLCLRTLRIPCRSLRSRLPSVDDRVALVASAAEPCAALFLDFAASYFRHVAVLPVEIHARVEQQLLDLLILAITGDTSTSNETSVRSGHRLRATRIIEQRFSDSTLQPADVARAVGVSERYLQKIFGDSGQTITTVIRNRRLAEAKRLLANRKQSRLGITQIALIVGFSDPAYFSRIFRQDCGHSPTDYQ
ncbi:AraC family transcriptional regulator [Paraburkholderia sp. MM5482-R1]|uniref:helix-turn-helix transcriptional regulator n=1 Tax=unclassified Paraburkholderia TaxID=2615204 RepID=UPI003D262445